MQPPAQAPSLPQARTPGRYHVAVVCLGNICRSPMADVVLNAHLADAGLADRVQAESFGTGDWHVGGPMDSRAAATLTAQGYDAARHRARVVDASTLETADLVLAMDRENLRDLAAVGLDPDRLRLFRDFDPDPEDGVVPDPYYGGDEGFTHVLDMVERTSAALAGSLQEEVS